MTKIIYEPYETRSDHGILVLTAGIPATIPVQFDMTYFDTTGVEHQWLVPDNFKIITKIKQDLSLRQTILQYEYENVEDNVFVLDISADDMALLRAGVKYVLTSYIVDQNNKPIKKIIGSLPIYVDGSGV